MCKADPSESDALKVCCQDWSQRTRRNVYLGRLGIRATAAATIDGKDAELIEWEDGNNQKVYHHDGQAEEAEKAGLVSRLIPAKELEVVRTMAKLEA